MNMQHRSQCSYILSVFQNNMEQQAARDPSQCCHTGSIWQHLAASGSIWHGLVHLVQLLLRLLHNLAWHVVRPRSTQVDPGRPSVQLGLCRRDFVCFQFLSTCPMASPQGGWTGWAMGVLDRPGPPGLWHRLLPLCASHPAGSCWSG